MYIVFHMHLDRFRSPMVDIRHRTHGCPVDNVHVHHTQQENSLSVLPFSKLNNFISGYFDPENAFLDNENK